MKKIEIISRAVIIKEEDILVCQEKNSNYYFLPGGHVEFGEFSKEALLRELQEELFINVSDTDIIGVVENQYSTRGEDRQEINFIYKIDYSDINIKSKEEHIDFYFLPINSLEKEDVRPKDLKEAIIKWNKDKKFFNIKTID